MYNLILSFHIAGGATALVTAAGALMTSKGDRWHVYSGRAFALGMLVDTEVTFGSRPTSPGCWPGQSPQSPRSQWSMSGSNQHSWFG